MTIESSAEFDARLRREAMAWLTVRTNDGLDPISTKDLLDFQISSCFVKNRSHNSLLWTPM